MDRLLFALPLLVFENDENDESDDDDGVAGRCAFSS